ncbi:UNVERIFIED_CONTAM: hypothetical protein NCL1_32866 [Trichonephila clavipes]
MEIFTLEFCLATNVWWSAVNGKELNTLDIAYNLDDGDLINIYLLPPEESGCLIDVENINEDF